MLSTLQAKIMKESKLCSIKGTLNNTKIEHEEHRGDIAKLVNMKKKLVTEISKHQSVLEKYKKISEKMKFEQAMDQQPTKEKEETTAEKVIITKEKKPGDQFLKV